MFMFFLGGYFVPISFWVCPPLSGTSNFSSSSSSSSSTSSKPDPKGPSRSQKHMADHKKLSFGNAILDAQSLHIIYIYML